MYLFSAMSIARMTSYNSKNGAPTMAKPDDSDQLNGDEYNDLKEDNHKWSTLELMRRWKSLKDVKRAGSGLSMKEWESQNGEGIWENN